MRLTRTRVAVTAALIGLAVLTAALYFSTLAEGGTAQIIGYQRTSDARRIVVVVALGRLEDIADRQVSEDDRSVRITVRKHSTAGTAPADLQFFPVTVTLPLGHSLGDRAVLNDKGEPLSDLGVYGAPFPSPPR